MSLHKQLITQLSGKMARPFGLRLKKRHSVLLVAHLEQPNYAPRALIGDFSGATAIID